MTDQDGHFSIGSHTAPGVNFRVRHLGGSDSNITTTSVENINNNSLISNRFEARDSEGNMHRSELQFRGNDKELRFLIGGLWKLGISERGVLNRSSKLI